MKKLTALLVAIVLCLSLCACGGGNTDVPADKTTASVDKNDISTEKAYSLGDTITTDIIEFSLTRVEFSDQLKYATFSTGEQPDTGYMLPTTEPQSNKTFVANEGYTFLSYSYSLRYTGKEEIEVETAMGISADYNDGYTFEIWSDAYMWSEYISIKGYTKLRPLDPQGEGRGCMKVPEEVSTNSVAPLKINVSIPNGDGTTTDAVYIIR